MLLFYNYLGTFQNRLSQNVFQVKFIFFPAMFLICCWSQTYSAAVSSAVSHKETQSKDHTRRMPFARRLVMSALF